jgi:hypothetical protein
MTIFYLHNLFTTSKKEIQEAEKQPAKKIAKNALKF